MYCYLILALVIILLLCRNNLNIEKFSNFSSNLFNRCLESLNITQDVICRKKKFCKDDYKSGKCNIQDTVAKCDNSKTNQTETDTALILNASNADKDVSNRRTYKNFLESVEINSLQNNKTWCENSILNNKYN